jgi:putrescine transport system permease protein
MGGAFAVHLGMVHVYLPFMVLPLYARIRAIDPELEDAAADLGATPLARFATVVLPLAMPGLIAGSLLVFIPASAEFVIPELLGSSDTPMLGRTIWNEFFANRDWPAAAALALALFALLALPIVALQRYGSAR